jgi:biopolymer transport protein ExbB
MTKSPHPPSRLSRLTIALSAALLAPPLLAATGAADTPAAGTTLFERVMGGGVFFMSALLAISVVMVWLVIDGWLRTARGRLAPEPLAAALRQRLAAGDYENAVALARRDDSALGRVALAALGQAGHGPQAVEDAVFEQTERERAAFQARISYLSVIGVITPMIGLNGTVFGMIRAFNTLGAGGAGDSARLASAIGTVLVATAGGLLIAIPAFAAYYILRNRVAAGFRHLQEHVSLLFRHLPHAALRGRRLDPLVFVPAPPKAAVADDGEGAPN